MTDPQDIVPPRTDVEKERPIGERYLMQPQWTYPRPTLLARQALLKQKIADYVYIPFAPALQDQHSRDVSELKAIETILNGKSE